MTTSPATALKKELVKTFPNTKFSVTTKTSHVTVNWIIVEWSLPVYTNATEKAVREIAKKHESIERRGNSIDDTAWATGYSVSFAPKYSTERKDWALQATEIHNIIDAIWDAKYNVFKQASGRTNWEATDKYYEYLRNGIFCDLVDENGNQPSAKICYYKEVKAQSKSQPETLESEPEVKIVATTKGRMEVSEIRKGTTNASTVQFAETVTGRLLDDQDNLVLEYGNPVYFCVQTSEITPSPEQPQQSVESEQDTAPALPIKPETDKEKCVKLVEKIQPAMFDPETVALCIEDSATPIAPATPETNLIPFPSSKQPEPQPIAQQQSNDGDSFYLQSYQGWVNKLVARGEYGKIKSYEEWYAIAVEVM